MAEESREFFLLVETDSYSGNFERELSAFAFGVVDEHAPSSIELPSHATAELEDYFSFWGEAIGVLYSEYGPMPYEIFPDEQGNYTVIRYPLDAWGWEELQASPKYITMLWARLKEAAAQLTYSDERDSNGVPLPIKILGVKCQEEVKVIKVHELSA